MTAYVLLSGGIDSTTCLYTAHQNYEQVVGVSIDYGQRHKKEVDYARVSCQLLKVEHHVLDLSSIVPSTMLTDPSQKIPDVSYAEIEGVSPAYVPFRNGLMLSALASYVSGEYDLALKTPPHLPSDGGVWAIYFGAHSEDAHNWAYADCSYEFTGAMANAIYTGTYQQIRLMVPLQWMVKVDIIRLGQRLGVPFENTWSCYKGGEKHCGVCPTCRSRRQGFIDAHVPDPTVYEDD